MDKVIILRAPNRSIKRPDKGRLIAAPIFKQANASETEALLAEKLAARGFTKMPKE
jgi:hypothetical protein